MFLDLASWTLGGVSGWAFSLFVVCSHFIRLIVSQINDEARGGRGRRRATLITVPHTCGARAARESESATGAWRAGRGRRGTLLTGTLRGR